MSNNSSATIVSRVTPSLCYGAVGWNYPPSLSELRRPSAHVLKNVGGGYGPAWRGIEQITYLLFLKLTPPSLKLRRAGSEMTELGFDPPSPRGYGGTSNPDFLPA